MRKTIGTTGGVITYGLVLLLCYQYIHVHFLLASITIMLGLLFCMFLLRLRK